MDERISNPRKSVAIVAWLSLILLVYFSTIFTDFLIQRISDQQSMDTLVRYRKSQQAEFQREVSEDALYVGKAKADGYKPMLFPTLYDREGWTNLANSYGIAPLAAQPNTDLYFCNEGYGLIKYHSDRFGFRNEDAVWDQEGVDGVIIGDSFGQGACVGFEQSISGLLAQDGLKIINLSSIGNSPIHYASLIKVFGNRIRYKYLLMIFYANDNMENEEYGIFNKLFIERDGSYFSNKYSALSELRLADNLLSLYSASENKIGPYIANQPHVDPTIEVDRKIAEIMERKNGFSFTLQNLRQSAVSFYQASIAHTLPYSSRLAIDVAVEACHDDPCKTLFFYIPNSEYWRPDSRAKAYASGLKSYINSKGANFVDLSPYLAPLGDSAYAKAGPHLSPEGYEIVSKRLKAEMK